MPFFPVVRVVATKTIEHYFRLRVNQRLYINAAVLLPFAVIGSLTLNSESANAIWIFFAVYWTAAICYDLVRVYKRVVETTLGKGILLLLFGLCTNFAVVLSSQITNSITAIDPSTFPHTVAFLSILTVPIFAVAGLAAIFFVLLIGSATVLMFHMLPDDRIKEGILPGYALPKDVPFPKATQLIQIVSVAIFCGLVFEQAQKVSSRYNGFLTESAQSFLYNWEMYEKAPCSLEAGAKAAFMGEGKVFVGKKLANGYSFKVQECNPNGV